MAESKEESIFGTDQSRRGEYKFGKGNIIYYKPSNGFPTPEEAKKKPSTGLQLEHIYGFNGGALSNKYYRYKQHLISKSGSLIYFMAAAGVVHKIEDSSQRHFLAHNDDVTTICVDPRPGSTLVCSGQKDPKDRPGQGKDLPKMYIWDYETMKEVVLIDKVCNNLIRRVQWSLATGYVYAICSEEQQLKVYDTSGLGPAKKPNATKQAQNMLLEYPTTRQLMHGFVINPKPPSDCVDEIMFFCDGFLYMTKITMGKNKKLEGQRLRSITTKNKEKAFICGVYLNDGSWAVGGASGTLYLGQENKLLKEISLHKKPITSICASANGETIYTCSSDETVKALDKKGKEKWQSKPLRVDGSDFRCQPAAMDVDEAGDALFIGSKSNQIARFDLKTQTTSIVVDGHDGQIWGVSAHNEERTFVTGGYDKAVKAWNPETHTCVGTYEFQDKDVPQKDEKTPEKWEIGTCSMSNDGKWVAIGTTTSTVAILSFPKLEFKVAHFIPLANANNALEGVENLRWSPDNSFLAVVHGDANCYIIGVEVDESQNVKLHQWKGLNHRAAPSHVQWSDDGKIVKCLTRDYEVVHWLLDFKKKSADFSTKIPDPDKVQWHGDPLVAGWDVQGCYQKGWDGTDLNAVCLTSDRALVASGDDFGTVRLHNYPAIDTEAQDHYGGHAEFVVGVDFLVDDSYLISVGGADMAIFQWKLVKK